MPSTTLLKYGNAILTINRAKANISLLLGEKTEQKRFPPYNKTKVCVGMIEPMGKGYNGERFNMQMGLLLCFYDTL